MGHYFAFASFNDSQIGLFDLTYYGDLRNQYVENKKLLYPKVCEMLLGFFSL